MSSLMYERKLGVLWKEQCILSDWAGYISQGTLNETISNIMLIIASAIEK